MRFLAVIIFSVVAFPAMATESPSLLLTYIPAMITATVTVPASVTGPLPPNPLSPNGGAMEACSDGTLTQGNISLWYINKLSRNVDIVDAKKLAPEPWSVTISKAPPVTLRPRDTIEIFAYHKTGYLCEDDKGVADWVRFVFSDGSTQTF